LSFCSVTSPILSERVFDERRDQEAIVSRDATKLWEKSVEVEVRAHSTALAFSSSTTSSLFFEDMAELQWSIPLTVKTKDKCHCTASVWKLAAQKAPLS